MSTPSHVRSPSGIATTEAESRDAARAPAHRSAAARGAMARSFVMQCISMHAVPRALAAAGLLAFATAAGVAFADT